MSQPPRPRRLSTPGPGVRRDAYAPRDRSTLWVALVCLAAAQAGALALLPGCASTISCPPGTYPATSTSEQETSGQGQASVPSMAGGAGWSSEARLSGKCRLLCPKDWAWGGVGCVKAAPTPRCPDGGVK